MIFLPDTNVWIRFLNPGKNQVKNHFLSADPSTIFLCSVVKAGLFFGALKSTRIKENLGLLDELFANFESFFFDDDAPENTVRSVLISPGKVRQLARTT